MYHKLLKHVEKPLVTDESCLNTRPPNITQFECILPATVCS